MWVLAVDWLILVIALGCGWWVTVGGWDRRATRRFTALCGAAAGWSFFAVMEQLVSAGGPSQWAGGIKLFFRVFPEFVASRSIG